MGQKYTEKKKKYWRKKATTKSIPSLYANEKKTFKQKIRDFIYKVFGI